MHALVTGATGLVGRQLVAQLEKPAVLSRDPERARKDLGSVVAHAWVPDRGPPPLEALRDVDVVFNLAGEPVAEGRWTPEKKQRIRDSRVVGTRNLVAGLRALPQKPRALISTSAIGFYGDRGDTELDETSAPGADFLAEVCQAWEAEALAAEALGVRVVCLRLGVVLASGGGALARMLPPFRLGLGGPLGDGRQWMSWIHIDDVVGLLLHAATRDDLRGAVNTVAPTPITNGELTRTLGRVLHRPAVLPVPRAALRLALGEVTSVVLASQRVLPRAAERSGYAFRYPQLEAALRAAIST